MGIPKPAVSVVLTTYNRGPVVRATIAEILSQTFSDFELIICDDASTDDTYEQLQEAAASDGRIRVKRQPVNVGMPRNLNTGLLEAQGDYVANLHDGDGYAPNLLETWVNALDRCPEAGFVFCACRNVDATGREVSRFETPLPPCGPGDGLLDLAFKNWRFFSPVWGTVMARRAAYQDLGVLDERFGFLADIDMWYRFADRYNVAYVDQPLITLPPRTTLARQWALPEREAQRILERIWWEARQRRYGGRPGRLSLEVGRHLSHVIASRSLQRLFQIRRLVLRRVGILPST